MSAERGTGNPLRALHALGQRVWLDDLSRRLVASGELARLIEADCLAGVTSNPAIFHQAITRHDDYEAQIVRLAAAGADATAIYEAVAIDDVGRAADVFRPLYERTNGADGYVSLEVSPHLARDTEGTVDEARRLWAALGRPNAMIKVPGTREGLPAIRRLLAEGVNVNVTLLFSVERYAEVLEAHLAALEERAARGAPLEGIASVASFFLSRIDVLVDRELDRLGGAATALRGAAAIASARLAYAHFRGIVASPRWRTLARLGARPQLPLWASTGVKDPAYPDVKYVEALIGPQTVTTLPRATLDAFRDHGSAEPRLERELERARAIPDELRAHGIDLAAVAARLEEDGIRKFVEPFDALLAALRR